MKLMDFAYLGSNFAEEKLLSLAEMTKEKWSFDGSPRFSILKNYVCYTFERLWEEGKVIETTEYAIFDTGLFSEYFQEIYAFFTPNKIQGRQKWYLNNFYTKYQCSFYSIPKFPSPANYFEHPELLVFDVGLEVIPQYEHIFGKPENLERIPLQIRNDPNKQTIFDGALRKTISMIKSNYRVAVPQYYPGNGAFMGRIQLLIPIYLINEKNPDLALVVSKNEQGTAYYGRTCLSLEMAYSNARLISKPLSDWLNP